MAAILARPHRIDWLTAPENPQIKPGTWSFAAGQMP
jgi:hypothetical protein